MRITAFVLGLIGGVMGVLFGLVALAVGGTANAVNGSGNEVVGLGISAIAAAGFGILCASAYFGGWHRTLMSWGILAAAVWHLISISWFGIFGFLLLLLSAVFAWFGRKDSPRSLALIADTRGDIESRLDQLLQLRESGVITDDEYTERRGAVLSEL